MIVEEDNNDIYGKLLYLTVHCVDIKMSFVIIDEDFMRSKDFFSDGKFKLYLVTHHLTSKLILADEFNADLCLN